MTEPAAEVPADPAGLVVSTAELARRAGITVTAANHPTLVDAILDAQADVSGHLGRAIVPTSYTETGRWSVGDEWSLTPLDEPLIEVTAVVAETLPDGSPTGLFTITYTAGLDAALDPALRPIRRYVLAHALNAPEILRLWQQTTGERGPVRSVSAEGQSISWGDPSLGGGGEPGSGRPGALPTLASLDRWRVAGRRVYQRRTSHFRGAWPHRPLDPHRGY